MRLAITISLFLSCLSATAQKDTSLVGKWMIVSISDDEKYMNIEKDSVAFSKELASSLEDSIRTKALLSAMLPVFRGSTLFFGKDGSYEMVSNGEPDGTGTYTADKAKGLIRTTVQRNNLVVDKTIRYFIKDGMLYTKQTGRDQPKMDMVFRKVAEKP